MNRSFDLMTTAARKKCHKRSHSGIGMVYCLLQLFTQEEERFD